MVRLEEMSLELVVAVRFVVVVLGWIGLDVVDCCDTMPEYLVVTGRRYAGRYRRWWRRIKTKKEGREIMEL